MKLNEVCEILAGYAFNANDFITNGFPIIKIKNISLDERVNYDVNSTIDPQLIKPSIFLKYLCVKDDFVIAMTGNTIGKMGRIVEGKYLLNQRVAKFIPFTNICLKRYLFYALSNPKFKLFIENNLDSSTAQANISTSTLGNYELTIHSIDEQQHIVNTIGTVDDLIEKYQEIVEKIVHYGDLLQAGKTNKKNIVDIAKIKLGGTPSRNNKSFWTNGKNKWINSGCLTNNYVINGGWEFIADEGHKRVARNVVKKVQLSFQ